MVKSTPRIPLITMVFWNWQKLSGKAANRFIQWFTYSDETIDGQSKSKAYALFDSTLLDTIEVGTVKELQQIHAYLFGGLYDCMGRSEQPA